MQGFFSEGQTFYKENYRHDGKLHPWQLPERLQAAGR
jgi:hypothetical protein